MQRTRRSRDDRGALSIEFLLIISALMLVFLLTLQYAVKAHATRVAQAAAEEALFAASTYDGSAAAGESAGTSYLAGLGNLSATSVAVSRTATTTSVTVTGRAEQLVPFLPVRITVRIEGPTEQFVDAP